MPQLAHQRMTTGSIPELWRVAFPMMLMALSANLMLFFDRLILSNYSLDAMSASAAAGTAAAVFEFGALAIAAIAEVFVGQYNGAKQYDKVAEPVWQMIWFSLATYILFIPVGLYAGCYLVPGACHIGGINYFKILMLFGPFVPLMAALSSFFIGRGVGTYIVTLVVLIGNITNLFLNVILVFGVDGFIPSMGIEGSAYATVTSEVVQVLILLVVFLSAENRQKYNTGNCKFNFTTFSECIKVGIPSAISHTLEISAWTALFHIVAAAHPMYIAVQAIGQTVFTLFGFLIEGLQKGVGAVSSNMIGAHLVSRIPLLLRSSVALLGLIVIALFPPLFIFPDLIIRIFADTSNMDSDVFHQSILACRYVWVYCVIDGLVWIFAGILTSGGDTRFIMWTNILTVWFFAISPVYISIHYFNASASSPWIFAMVYSGCNLLLFALRYHSQKWLQLDLSVPDHVHKH